MDFKTYKDKVKACWLGKNIGGTLGAPFECIRGAYDLEYYTHDLSQGVLPNDDLDLQLIWLNAAERYGKGVNAEILGEYWLSYIVADWSEYGAAKNNLAFGLQPPISGWYHNHNKDSCGCFIRSEIWACLAPGHPEIAVKYAREDAICDHADEGLYGELFCAAMQSAAFVESDMYKLIEIGLAYIPETSAVAGAVKLAIRCYKEGKTWKEARKEILRTYPGSFGMYNGYKEQEPEADVPVGELGYDAPSNIGLMIMGWVYGEGDFSKSICIAAGACEDGDCTAGTLAATMGIIGGTAIIDEKWLIPIGDEIKTISIDRTKDSPDYVKEKNLITDYVIIPNTVTELAERVVKLMPTFMNGYFEYGENGEMMLEASKNLAETNIHKGAFEWEDLKEELCANSVSIQKENVLMKVRVEYDKDIFVSEGTEKKFTIHIENKLREQQWLQIKWHIPQEWQVTPAKEMTVYADQPHGGYAITKTKASIVPNMLSTGKYDITLEISSCGRAAKLYIPITLLVGVQE